MACLQHFLALYSSLDHGDPFLLPDLTGLCQAPTLRFRSTAYLDLGFAHRDVRISDHFALLEAKANHVCGPHLHRPGISWKQGWRCPQYGSFLADVALYAGVVGQYLCREVVVCLTCAKRKAFCCSYEMLNVSFAPFCWYYIYTFCP